MQYFLLRCIDYGGPVSDSLYYDFIHCNKAVVKIKSRFILNPVLRFLWGKESLGKFKFSRKFKKTMIDDLSSQVAAAFPAVVLVYTVLIWASLHFRVNHKDRGVFSSSSGRLRRPGLLFGHTKEFWFFICGLLSAVAVGMNALGTLAGA